MSLKSRLASKFGDAFSGTSQDSFESNDPALRGNSNRITYIHRDIKLFKPQENEEKQVRFITIPELNYFSKLVRVHFNIGADNHSLTCPATKGANNCPLCAKGRELWQESKETTNKEEKEALQEQAKKYYASDYNLTWIVDRQNPEAGVMMWPISGKETINTIRGLMTNRRTKQVISIDNPEAGRDIFFIKKKDGNSRFATIQNIGIDDQDTPLSEDEDEAIKWLEFVFEHPLEDIINYVSAEEMERLAFPTAAQYSDDDDSEESEKEETKQPDPPASLKQKKEEKVEEKGEEKPPEKEPTPSSGSSRLASIRDRLNKNKPA